MGCVPLQQTPSAKSCVWAFRPSLSLLSLHKSCELEHGAVGHAELTSTPGRVLVHRRRRAFSVLEFLSPVLQVRVYCLPGTKPVRNMAPGHSEKVPS